MLIKQLSLRLEISFWQLLIALMHESSFVQNIIRWGYHRLLPIVFGLNQLIDLKKVINWGLAGFFIGLATSLIITLL